MEVDRDVSFRLDVEILPFSHCGLNYGTDTTFHRKYFEFCAKTTDNWTSEWHVHQRNYTGLLDQSHILHIEWSYGVLTGKIGLTWLQYENSDKPPAFEKPRGCRAKA